MRKQKVLIIKIGRGKVNSKPWDFEAMCLVDDNRMAQNDVQRCIDAVYYLFEGTKITNEYLESMSYDRLRELCEQVRDWYVEDVLKLLKIQKNTDKKQAKNNKGLRGIYTSFFNAWGILGDAIARQRPEHIFALLEENESAAVDNMIDELSPEVRAMYGM